MRIRKMIMGRSLSRRSPQPRGGLLPFGAGAQDRPVGLLNFNDFVCPVECSINAPVCCAILPPIIVEG